MSRIATGDAYSKQLYAYSMSVEQAEAGGAREEPERLEDERAPREVRERVCVCV